jgi:MFS family permease
MSTQQVPAPAPASPRALLSVVVLCFGGLSAALTQTLVIPIQSELPRLLHTSADNASWVVTSTLLAGAVAMPIAGRLADMFGKQRVLMVSAVLLMVGSLICAQADSLLPMLAGRTFQGISAGFIPVGISLMREITPPHMTTSAIAAMSATLGVGGAIGLPLAAWVAQDFNWHALFWMSAGLAVMVTVGVATVVPHVHDAGGGRLDVVGALGLAAGLVATLVAVTKGNTWGWGEPRTLGFLLTNLAAVAVGFGMMAQAIVVPQLLQLPSETGFGFGQTILEAGLWMAPGGLMMMVFAPLSGRMMDRAGAKPTLMLGAAVLGGGYLVAAFLTHAPWQLLVASCISSAGVGIGYAAMPTLILAAVPMREAASAVGINALMRSVGTTSAAAVMAMLLTSRTTSFAGMQVPSESAFTLCFVVGAVAAFVGVAITAAIPVARRHTARLDAEVAEDAAATSS